MQGGQRSTGSLARFGGKKIVGDRADRIHLLLARQHMRLQLVGWCGLGNGLARSRLPCLLSRLPALQPCGLLRIVSYLPEQDLKLRVQLLGGLTVGLDKDFIASVEKPSQTTLLVHNESEQVIGVLPSPGRHGPRGGHSPVLAGVRRPGSA